MSPRPSSAAVERMPPVPLVLIGGTLCDEALWQGVRPALGRVARSVVGRWGDECEAGDLARRLLAEMPDGRFALAGMSMGGSIALEVCAQAPERVVGLALIDAQPWGNVPPPASPSRPEPGAAARHAARMAQIEHARTHGLRSLIADRLWPAYVHPSRHGDTGLRDALAAMAERCGLEAFERQVELLRRRVDRHALLPALAARGLPLLALWGEADALCPDALQRRWTAAVSPIRTAALPGCGHFAILEDPAAAAAPLLDWLGDCRAALTPD